MGHHMSRTDEENGNPNHKYRTQQSVPGYPPQGVGSPEP